MARDLASLLGTDDLGQQALRLLQSSMQRTTASTYGSALNLFVEFCEDERLRPLNVTPVDIVRYIAWIGCRGSVAADSLQPYLSAINRFLQDHGRAPVAQGPIISDARRGLRNSQIDLSPQAARVALPAPVAHKILQHAQLLTSQLDWTTAEEATLHLVRAMTATITAYCFFNRSETGLKCHTADLVVDSHHITLFKRVAKGHKADLHHQKQLHQLDASALPAVANLLTAYLAGRRAYCRSKLHQPPEALWAFLPSDAASRWTSATQTSWLTAAVQAVNCHPPAGFSWSSHSLRKGAASAAHAIGVPLEKIRYMGGWSKTSMVVLDYIDPTMQASEAAVLFFGHLMPASLQQLSSQTVA